MTRIAIRLLVLLGIAQESENVTSGAEVAPNTAARRELAHRRMTMQKPGLSVGAFLGLVTVGGFAFVALLTWVMGHPLWR